METKLSPHLRALNDPHEKTRTIHWPWLDYLVRRGNACLQVLNSSCMGDGLIKKRMLVSLLNVIFLSWWCWASPMHAESFMFFGVRLVRECEQLFFMPCTKRKTSFGAMFLAQQLCKIAHTLTTIPQTQRIQRRSGVLVNDLFFYVFPRLRLPPFVPVWNVILREYKTCFISGKKTFLLWKQPQAKFLERFWQTNIPGIDLPFHSFVKCTVRRVRAAFHVTN